MKFKRLPFRDNHLHSNQSKYCFNILQHNDHDHHYNDYFQGGKLTYRNDEGRLSSGLCQAHALLQGGSSPLSDHNALLDGGLDDCYENYDGLLHDELSEEARDDAEGGKIDDDPHLLPLHDVP